MSGTAFFTTENEKESDESFPSKVEYFMFRDDKTDKFIKMKVRPVGAFNVFISHQENIGNNTHSLEFLDSKINFGYFITKKGKNKYNQLEELEWASLEDTHGIWILLQSNKLHVGSWNTDDGYTTLGAFKIEKLSEMRFLGFSSFEKTDWIISNGKYYEGKILKIYIYVCDSCTSW